MAHHSAARMQHLCNWGQLRTKLLPQAGSQCKISSASQEQPGPGALALHRGRELMLSHVTCANALARHALEPSCARQDGKTVEQIEGADAAALREAISKHCPTSSVQGPINPAAIPAANLAQAAPSANGAQQHGAQQDRAAAVGQDITRRIKQLLASSPILLFMKVCSSCSNSALVIFSGLASWAGQADGPAALAGALSRLKGWKARPCGNGTSPHTTASLCSFELVSPPSQCCGSSRSSVLTPHADAQACCWGCSGA